MPLRMRLRQYEAPCFDLTGQRFGLLTAVKKVGKSVGCNGVQWLCKCQCGGSKVVGSVLLRRGKNFIVRMPETRAEAASMDRGKAFGDEMKRKPPSHGLFAASLALILASIRLQLGRVLIIRDW